MPVFRPTGLLVALLVCAPAFVHAQLENMYDQWRWVHFGTESGLLSDKVWSVHETREGDVWVQSGEGPAWFDGYLWHPVGLPGLDGARAGIGRVAIDSQGVLISVAGMLYEVRTGGSRRVSFANAIDTVRVYSAWRSPTGRRIIQGDETLYTLTGDSLALLPSPYDDPLSDVLLDKRIANFLIPLTRDLWLKAGTRLFRFGETSWREMYSSSAHFLRVHHLVDDGAGNGMAVLEPDAGHMHVYEWEADGPLRRLPDEPGDLILSIAAHPDGGFLLLYPSGRLRLRSRGTWQWLNPLPPPVEHPEVLRFRSNGDLWVGGDRGLFLCRRSSTRWTLWQGPPASLENIVNEIFRARDGTFWIGTRDGVSRRSPDGRVERITHIGNQRLGRVTAIGQDAAGHLWVGSGATFSGAFRWDGRTWKKYGIREGLPAPRVHKITRDRTGRLWFLGIGEGELRRGLKAEPGAFLYDKGTFTHWGPEEGLLDGRVYAMLEDRRGGLWFGTWLGVSRLRDGNWRHWTVADGLQEKRVWDIEEDSTGRILLCHQWIGLGVIEPNDSLHYVYPDEGLVSGQIWDIEVDHRGRIWLATFDGLGCFDGKEWTAFDTYTGLPNAQLWPVLPFGDQIYVGTQGNGVAILSLPQLNQVPARIRIGPQEIDADVASISWLVNAYWADAAPRVLETRFRLDGGPWSAWSTARNVVYSNLSMGDHRFEVQSRPLFDADSIGSVSMGFVVPPPLLLRLPVLLPIGALSLLVIGMVAAGYKRKREYDRVLRESEARLRAQYQGNPIPTLTLKRQGESFVMKDFNEAADQLTRGEARQWLGSGLEWALARAPEIIDDIRRCWVEKSTVRREFLFTFAHAGQPSSLDVTFTYVSPDMILVHAEDVTLRKQSERRLSESREQLRALAARLESVREDERTSLSREIHDELGQMMTGLKMDLAWMKRRCQESGTTIPDVVLQRMGQMSGMLEDSIHTVRRIAAQLRPAVLDDLGLSAALEWQVREFQERTGIPCRIAIDAEDVWLTPAQSTALFRIAQELLTNIIRHAHASEAWVSLRTLNDAVVLDVRDNGCGIKHDDPRKPSALGILGMEERARQIGALFSIRRGENGGTVASVRIPRQRSDTTR